MRAQVPLEPRDNPVNRPAKMATKRRQKKMATAPYDGRHFLDKRVLAIFAVAIFCEQSLKHRAPSKTVHGPSSSVSCLPRDRPCHDVLP